jgi:predicted dienelactone hydrolase
MSIKKAVPLLWRYLVVVFTSCLLATVISHSHAHAAEAGNDYGSAGPYKFRVTEAVWTDAARKRDIPVRIESPTDAAKETKWPVVLFSHGLGGTREGGIYWGEHWASHGYVVVHMQHAGSDDALWKGKGPVQAVTSAKAGMSMENLKLRIDDVHFVIDEIARRAKAGEASFAAADPSRIGMSGHSFGAQTTLAVGGQQNPFVKVNGVADARITSLIAFSPNARNKIGLEKQFGEITRPFFSVTGTRDGAILGDDTKPEDRTLPYRNMPAGDKYLAVFKDGDHMVFGGHVLGARRPVTPRDGEIQREVKAATLAFWDATLKGSDAARKWLQVDFKSTLGEGDRFEWK